MCRLNCSFETPVDVIRHNAFLHLFLELFDFFLLFPNFLVELALLVLEFCDLLFRCRAPALNVKGRHLEPIQLFHLRVQAALSAFLLLLGLAQCRFGHLFLPFDLRPSRFQRFLSSHNRVTPARTRPRFRLLRCGKETNVMACSRIAVRSRSTLHPLPGTDLAQ